MIRNLTPHPVVIDGRTLDPEGLVPRVQTTAVPAEAVDGFGAVRISVEEVADLPAPQDGVFLLVSRVVFDNCPERLDVICPDTGPDSVIRDSDGRVVGVKRVIRR